MMRIDLSRYAPPGTNIEKEIKNLCVGLAAATCCAVLVYGVRLRTAYDNLFDQIGRDRVLQTGAIMLPFDAILLYALWLFYLVAFYSLASAVLHHITYYTGGSKSIYLMRRLPQRWELLRRDITLPLLGASISLLSALLLKLLFWGLYYWITPTQCLP